MAAYTDPQSVSSKILTDTSGNDKHSIKVTGKGVDEYDAVYADSNLLVGGDGKDKFDISTKHSGYSNIYANTISAGNDADKIKLVTQSKSRRSLVDENNIDLGDGKDSLQIDTKSSTGDSDIYANTIIGGDGDFETNTVKLSASNKGSATGNDPGSVVTEDATIIGNTITTYDGADNHTLSAKSGDGYADISDNTIDAGDGDNKIALNASNKGTPLEFIDGGGIPYSHFATQASIGSNSILTGYGDSTISLTSKSSKSSSEIFANDIQSGYGDDKLSLSSKGYTASIARNTINAGEDANQISLFGKGKSLAEISENEIWSDGGDDKITIKAQGDPVEIIGNLIDTGHGHNEIAVEAKAKGVGQISGNTISSGDYDDAIALSVSGEYTYIAMNHISTAAGVNEISLSAKTKGGGQIHGNVLLGGDYTDQIIIDLSAKKTAAFGKNFSSTGSGNIIDAGASNDTIDISIKGRFTDFRSNRIDGGTDNDSISISLDAQHAIFSNSVDDNLIEGGDGEDSVILNFSKKLGQASTDRFLDYNTIDGGLGDNDTLVIGSKNQLIDLTTVPSGNLVDMEIIDLGKSKSSLLLDDSSVVAATDADNLLLITGKGSVDLGGSSTFINEMGGFSYFDLGTSTVGLESSIDVIEIV